MSSRDPRDRWRWEEDEREREEREIVERDGRFARDVGDPRWGTGGMPVEERAYRAIRETSERGWPPRRREEIARLTPSYVEWESAGRGPYVGRGPRGYRRSDERIREDVCERFTEHGQLDPSDVEVSVRGGEVMLTGTVATRAQKRLAEDLADAVAGVAEVHNHLRVHAATPEAAQAPRGMPVSNGRPATHDALPER